MSAYDYLGAHLLVASSEVLAVQFDVNPQAPPGSDKFMTLLSWVGWGACLAAVIALLIAGGKFGFDKHQGTADSEAAKSVGKTLIGCVVIAVAGGLVGALAG